MLAGARLGRGPRFLKTAEVAARLVRVGAARDRHVVPVQRHRRVVVRSVERLGVDRVGELGQLEDAIGHRLHGVGGALRRARGQLLLRLNRALGRLARPVQPELVVGLAVAKADQIVRRHRRPRPDFAIASTIEIERGRRRLVVAGVLVRLRQLEHPHVAPPRVGAGRLGDQTRGVGHLGVGAGQDQDKVALHRRAADRVLPRRRRRRDRLARPLSVAGDEGDPGQHVGAQVAQLVRLPVAGQVGDVGQAMPAQHDVGLPHAQCVPAPPAACATAAPRTRRWPRRRRPARSPRPPACAACRDLVLPADRARAARRAARASSRSAPARAASAAAARSASCHSKADQQLHVAGGRPAPAPPPACAAAPGSRARSPPPSAWPGSRAPRGRTRCPGSRSAWQRTSGPRAAPPRGPAGPAPPRSVRPRTRTPARLRRPRRPIASLRALQRCVTWVAGYHAPRATAKRQPGDWTGRVGRFRPRRIRDI